MRRTTCRHGKELGAADDVTKPFGPVMLGAQARRG
jgi:hypothetical protein